VISIPTQVGNCSLVGGQTATFNGGASQAVATGLAPDTTKSFSVAAWVRLRGVDGYQTFVSKDAGAGQWSPFRLQAVNGHWCFQMLTSLTTNDGAEFLCSSSAAVAERWTHVAASFDSAEGKMRLWVDGTPYQKIFSRPVTTSGPIVLGRAMNAGSASDRTYGDVADVQVFDRVLVDQDFTGQVASDPDSGGFDEPGILSPIEVGSWDFEAAVPCYMADLRDTCEAPDARVSSRWLALSRGSATGAGYLTGDTGLWLDYEYFPEEGYTESTQEYGRTARKVGTSPPDADGNEFTQWQNEPVLKTDQSFTISAWVLLDRLDGMRTAVSQSGVHESASRLKFHSVMGRWQFVLVEEDTLTSESTSVFSNSSAETDDWVHLVGVYDADKSQIRIYVNGDLDGTASVSFTPFASSGPLIVGRTWWRDAMVDQWTGGIDNVRVFQGAMNDAQVKLLHDSETG